MSAVPALFLVVVFVAGLLGEVVARFYSEPMNQLIRQHYSQRQGDAPHLQSAEEH
jgi:hypothetical protein